MFYVPITAGEVYHDDIPAFAAVLTSKNQFFHIS
jgi:hypothetical protein